MVAISGSQQTLVTQIWREKTKRNDTYDFSVHCSTLEQNGSSHFFPSFDNANGRLCQERLLRSTNVATMVRWRHTSPLHWIARQQTIIHLPLNGIQWTCAYRKLFTNGRNQFKFDYHFFTMLLDISPYLHSTSLNWELYYTNFNNCGCYAQHK